MFHTMEPRIHYAKVAPDGYKALLSVGKYLDQWGLDPGLRHLVTVRASQINHCALCIDVHSKDPRALGETEQRLYLLDSWREAPRRHLVLDLQHGRRVQGGIEGASPPFRFGGS